MAGRDGNGSVNKLFLFFKVMSKVTCSGALRTDRLSLVDTARSAFIFHDGRKKVGEWNLPTQIYTLLLTIY